MAAKTRPEWPAGALALIPLFVVAAYFDLGTYGLVWDDFALFRHLAPDERLAGWDDVAAQPLPFSDNYFRPFALWTFYVVHALTEGSVGAQHWVNVAIHSANAFAVGWLARAISPRISTRRGVAMGCLYALHPALVEPTAWISGRFDLLLTSALLAMLVADLELRGRLLARVVFVSIAFLVGLASKETAVMLPLVLLLWWGVTTPTDPLRRARQNQGLVLASLGALLGAWLIVRVVVLGGLVIAEPSAVDGGFGARFVAATAAIQGYARIAIAPFGAASPIHLASSASGWLTWLRAIATLGALVALVAVSARKRRWASLLLAGLVLLIPVLHLQPLNLAGGALLAERYLAAPLVMVALALSCAPIRVPRGGRAVGLLVLLTCFGSVRSIAPNWSGPVDLWTWAEEKAPDSILPPINLAKTFYEAGNYPGALAAAERALDIEPDHPFAANNGCASLIELERPSEATVWCQIGLDSGRASPRQWVNLMRAQLADNDPSAAIETHGRAARVWNLRTERMEALLLEAIDRQNSQGPSTDRD